MFDGGPIVGLPEILGQIDPVRTKMPTFIASAVTPSEKS